MPLKPKPFPEIAILKELFDCNSDGRLINRVSRTARKKGEFADRTIGKNGYRVCYADGRLYYAHRIVWTITHGKEPDGWVDHINGDSHDNRPDNLRLCTHNQNMYNSRLRSDNPSGVKGVHKRRDTGMWRASIKANKKLHNLGQFETKEEACAAITKARSDLHGEFARSA